MKLTPPIVEIVPEDPYRNDLFKNDTFDRKSFGASLRSLIKSVDESIVLCVDAPWGEGKTTFAKMWIADLEKDGVQSIYFDAYQHDYSDDPFVSFCAEIISLAENEFQNIDVLAKSFKEEAIKIGGELLRTGAKIGVKALTYGIIGDSLIEEIKGDLADTTSNAVSKIIGRALKDYTSKKNSLLEFREKLSALGSAIREQQDFPLLIVIDELDRCRPDFALALIERIKHMFSTKDVVFVLLANMTQLQNYVKRVYGARVDARNYLYKFFTVTTNLPKNKDAPYHNDYIRYSRKLLEHFGCNKGGLLSILPKLFKFYNFTLREMEQCFVLIVLYFSRPMERYLADEGIVSFLSVLRLKMPDTFSGLANGNITYMDVLQKTEIEKIGIELLIKQLQFFLYSEEEFDALDREDPIRRYLSFYHPHYGKRREILERYCTELNRFVVPSRSDDPT